MFVPVPAPAAEDAPELPAFRRAWTRRGFPVLSLEDTYGKRFSIELSTLADDECVWAGRRDVGPGNHLNRDQAAQIGLALLAFAREGRALFERLMPPANVVPERRAR